LNTIESTGRSALADLRRLLRLLSTGDAPVDPSPGLAHLDVLTEAIRTVHAGDALLAPSVTRRLVVSIATVKTHVGRVFTKIGARDRAQAVVRAYQTGLASLPTG
jgi:DNA-binding NarL/FixJ family response regulator